MNKYVYTKYILLLEMNRAHIQFKRNKAVTSTTILIITERNKSYLFQVNANTYICILQSSKLYLEFLDRQVFISLLSQLF